MASFDRYSSKGPPWARVGDFTRRHVEAAEQKLKDMDAEQLVAEDPSIVLESLLRFPRHGAVQRDTKREPIVQQDGGKATVCLYLITPFSIFYGPEEKRYVTKSFPLSEFEWVNGIRANVHEGWVAHDCPFDKQAIETTLERLRKYIDGLGAEFEESNKKAEERIRAAVQSAMARAHDEVKRREEVRQSLSVEVISKKKALGSHK